MQRRRPSGWAACQVAAMQPASRTTPPSHAPTPSTDECELYYVQRDTLFSYHKVGLLSCWSVDIPSPCTAAFTAQDSAAQHALPAPRHASAHVCALPHTQRHALHRVPH